MAIRADDDGFILGERRLRELSNDIKETKDTTKDILQVLLRGVKTAIEAEGEKTREAIIRSSIDAANESPTSQHNPASDADVSQSPTRDSNSQSRQNRPLDSTHRPSKNADERNSNSAASRAANAREQLRGSDGRFIGAGENSNSMLGKLKGILEDLKPDNVDTSGIDPSLDALIELKQTLAPVTSIFSKMSGRARSLFTGRVKKRRNDEVLPEEQVRSNRREEQSDRERNRLLKRMLDALLRRNDGGGTDIDIGLDGEDGGNERDRRQRRNRRRGRGRGGRFRGLGKFAKGVPFVGGALAAALAFGDWDEQSFQEKGGTLGSLAGGAIGGGIGLLGGPIGAAVGTVIGSWAGEKLGGIVAPAIEPYFDKWTESLIKADLPTMLKSSWDGLTELVGKAVGLTPGGLIVSAASTIGSWGKGLWDKVTGERAGKFVLQQQYGGLAPNNTVPYNGNGDSVGKGTKAKQLAVFNAFKKAGFNDNWAAAYTASVGRENDYNESGLFGSHPDKAGGLNTGMISWQGSRRTKLIEFMRKRGLIDGRGNIIPGQASLDAQAEFKKWEIDNDPSFSGIKNYIDKNPNASKAEATNAIGKGDIKWAIYQDKLRNGESFPWRKHLQKEYNYRDSIDKTLQENGTDTKSTTPTQVPYVNKKPTETSAVKVVGAEKRPSIKVPQITPDISKIGSSQKPVVVSQQQSDSFIAQDVSNRGLAHTFSGGLGYNRITG
nr:phage tail tip lysozyme [uncultured Acinetobacter sp.]